MPKLQILTIFAIALTGAALTVWLAATLGGMTEDSINPRVIVGVLLIALVARVRFVRRTRPPYADDEPE